MLSGGEGCWDRNWWRGLRLSCLMIFGVSQPLCWPSLYWFRALFQGVLATWSGPNSPRQRVYTPIFLQTPTHTHMHTHTPMHSHTFTHSHTHTLVYSHTHSWVCTHILPILLTLQWSATRLHPCSSFLTTLTLLTISSTLMSLHVIYLSITNGVWRI